MQLLVYLPCKVDFSFPYWYLLVPGKKIQAAATQCIQAAMARDVLTERRVAQAEPLQVRSTAVDKEASNARPTQRRRALREGAAPWYKYW